MPIWDMSLEELETYRPDVPEPDGFDAFWDATLAEAREHDLALRLAPVDSGLTAVTTQDVTFAGFGGHPVKGWLHRPATAAPDEPLPAVVQFQGYGGGRGLPHEFVLWALAGYAHFVMDTRGQGSSWSVGDTPDPVGSPPSHPGFMTRGIEDPHDHYYRRVYTDATRAVEAVRAAPGVDAGRVAVVGGSQGGALAIAAGALVPDVVGVMTDVPFLCHIRRGVEQASEDPFAEVSRYLQIHRAERERAFATLSHFDGIHFSRRGRAPALFSVGLADTICPPSTVYAAYNAYAGPKEIRVYHDNDHEGGGSAHQVEQLRWLRAALER
jgi:cephalosporin-C deacetylase